MVVHDNEFAKKVIKWLKKFNCVPFVVFIEFLRVLEYLVRIFYVYNFNLHIKRITK